jgi:hypothetical protein
VNYILKAAARTAATACPSLSRKRVWPNVIRHTTDLWKLDLRLNERALQKLTPAGQAAPRFQADDPLLAFLKTL